MSLIREVTLKYKTVGRIESRKMDSPESALKYLKPIFDEDPMREHLIVLPVSTKHDVMGFHRVSIGTINESLAHPREIFKPLILISAYGFLLAHNHPSGDPTPSEADIRLTRRISEAAQMLQIKFLDHIIVGDGDEQYYSFKEHGLL